MVNDLVASAKIAILALPLKALVTMKVSAESATVVRWESPALVLDPFNVPSEKSCVLRDAMLVEVVC